MPKRLENLKNVKIVFRTYLRKTWIDLRQTKTKMINGLFYIYRGICRQWNCFVF